MAVAKPRVLKIRPIQSSTLSFNMNGILESHNRNLAQLGNRIKAFDLGPLYGMLGQVHPDGRMVFDAEMIRQYIEDVNGANLFTLRARSLAAALEKKTLQRQNAFLKTYKHTTEIAGVYEELYAPSGDPRYPASKLGRLENLQDRTGARHLELANAYTTDLRTGVVKVTTTQTAGTTDSTSNTVQTGDSNSSNVGSTTTSSDTVSNSEETSESNQTNSSVSDINSRPMAYLSRGHHLAEWPAQTDGDLEPSTDFPQVSRQYTQTEQVDGGVETGGKYQLSQRIDVQESINAPTEWNGTNWVELKETEPTFHMQRVDGSGSSSSSATANSSGESKTISNTSSTGDSSTTSENETNGTSSSSSDQLATHQPMEYAHPSAQNDINMQRKMLDLQNERLPCELFSHSVPHVAAIMTNELRILDLEIKQLQLNYIHSFLVSPLNGVVTGVFKDVGEHARSSEAVIQVDNDDEVLIVGRVNFRGRIDPGINVTVRTTNAFESGMAVTLTGTVASVRGHDADNDEYEVIFRCENRVDPLDSDNPHRIMPLNYSFDYNNVVVTIG